jgi:hypothetical protein
MEKDFNKWSKLKIKLDQRSAVPTFRQREIWWCHIGLNIGDEENGKSEKYHRPILVIKKFNRNIFLGIPLATQVKDNPYYYQFIFQNIGNGVMFFVPNALRYFINEVLSKHVKHFTKSTPFAFFF